jgi:surface antigen
MTSSAEETVTVRQPRSIFTLAALVTVPAAVALGVLGGGSSVSAAAPVPAVSAPVAASPEVVAHAVVAPKRAVAVARATRPTAHKATSAHRAVTRTAPAPAVEGTAKPLVKAAPKPTATTTKTTTTTTAVRTGNDYPYAGATPNASDKWGFTERQCVSFAAWRLARAGHAINNSQGWGSAYHWDDTARSRGVRVSSTPHVGAIAQWNVGEAGKVWMDGGVGRFTAGEYGHVGYVAAVYSDGSALIEQYNVQGNREYSVLRMTAPRYLF